MADSFSGTEVANAAARSEGSTVEDAAATSPKRSPLCGTSFDVEAANRDSRNLERLTSTHHRFRTQSAFLLETLGDFEDDGTESEAAGLQQDASANQVPPPKKPTSRIYYLDWLRILAIYLVVFYHCIQALDMINLWRGSEKLHVIAYKSSSLQVGMPVFFHISGRAQALTKQKRMRVTMMLRFQRLLVPFVIAYFLLIPFWQYVQFREVWDGPKWFIPWLFWFFQPANFRFHVGWLWFLPTLFVIGVLAAPIFLFAEERNPKEAGKYAAISITIWLAFSALLAMFSTFTYVTLLLFALGPIVCSTVVLFVPFPVRNSTEWSSERWLAVQLTTFLTILTQLGMVCSFRYEDTSEAWKAGPAFMLFTGFYVHGYFVQRWNVGAAEAERLRQAERLLERRNNRTKTSDSDSESGVGPSYHGSRNHPHYAQFAEQLPLWAGVWQLLVVGIMLLSVSVGVPVGEWEAEIFPIYSASYKDSPFFGAAHIAGTWAMVGLVVSWFQAYANKEFHPFVYKHATTSVIVVYIFHWVFIAPFAFWVCRDFGMMGGGWKLLDPLLTLVVGCAGPFALYVLFLRVPALGRLFGM